MDTKIIKLRFLAPVHFGDGRLENSAYTCDAATLFSALFIEALKIGINDEILAAASSGEMLLSDAFPYIGSELYLPKPMVPPGFLARTEQQLKDNNDSVMKKAFKRIKYLPAAQYNDYCAGKLDPLSTLNAFELGESTLQTKVNLTREHKDDAEPFHVGSFSYHSDAGIYFIYQGSYAIEPLLDMLQYSGIGGERSSGYGRFEYEITTDNPIGQAANALSKIGYFSLLSSAAPTSSEINDELLDGARYGLVRKSGFVQSQTHSVNPQKKRDFYTFSAGSVFAKRFEGDVFDVNVTLGAHPVYRYARAMWMEV